MIAKQQIRFPSSTTQQHIRRILYTTDLSPGADEALDYAIMLALTYGAKLLLCHCLEPLTPDGERQTEDFVHIEQLFEETIGSRVSPTDPPILDWEGLVDRGDPAKIIAPEAAEQQVDLIVMRSRRRPIAAALLGSTAESVCRSAPCPVLVTHPQEREWVDGRTGKVEIRRILVACDFSDYSKLALSYALMFAKSYESELHLLHVLPDEAESPWSPVFGNPVHLSTIRLQNAVPPEVYSWCNIKQIVVEGEPFHEVPAYARKNDIDLICMGAHGKDFGKPALFGSNADRILRQAPCPVFIARPLTIKVG